jgi:hypothetical protein
MTNKRLRAREPGREMKAEALANFMIVTSYGNAEETEERSMAVQALSATLVREGGPGRRGDPGEEVTRAQVLQSVT